MRYSEKDIDELNEYHESIHMKCVREKIRRKCHSDCKWFGKRYQKCSCCRRNPNLKDNYDWR